MNILRKPLEWCGKTDTKNEFVWKSNKKTKNKNKIK